MFLILSFLLQGVQALPNGQGSFPEQGFNSWYMLHHHLVNYTWEPGYVASTDFLAIAEFFKTSGLHALGYTHANWDDCVVVGRDPSNNNKLIPDPAAFPKGPRYVSDALAALGFSMGFYTVRGNVTCAGLNKYTPIRRPGSNGYEMIDAQTYAEWGITYLKDDTCGGPNVPYQIMGAALNASGNPTFFSLCEPGQGPQTAPIGRSIGNGWRIDEDDGGLWNPILDNVNMVAGLFPYSGCDEQHNMDGKGCGWNDMGLLMVSTVIFYPPLVHFLFPPFSLPPPYLTPHHTHTHTHSPVFSPPYAHLGGWWHDP
jgi:alpha-galactosidase